MKPTYGIGYEPIGDLVDFIDPFGLRKIPSKVNQKVDNYVNQKAQHAAVLAEQHVEAGVTRAINGAGQKALLFAAGGLAIGALWGGLALYRRHKEENA